MLHRDFLAELDAGTRKWSVRHIGGALLRGFGIGGAFRYYLAFTILLVPTMALAGYAIYSSRLNLLAWCVLAVIGFRNSNTEPTGIGVIACFVIAIAGACIALVYGEIQFLGGILTGITWFGACAIKGVAMSYVEDKLRTSPEYFEMLERDGSLYATPSEAKPYPGRQASEM